MEELKASLKQHIKYYFPFYLMLNVILFLPWLYLISLFRYESFKIVVLLIVLTLSLMILCWGVALRHNSKGKAISSLFHVVGTLLGVIIIPALAINTYKTYELMLVALIVVLAFCWWSFIYYLKAPSLDKYTTKNIQ